MQRATGSPTEGGVKWEWERREMNGGGKRGGGGGAGWEMGGKKWEVGQKKEREDKRFAPDEDGIRTHACRAQWISSPSP